MKGKTDLTPCEQRLDGYENITPRIFPFDQAMEMIEKGKIQDATTILGPPTRPCGMEGKTEFV